MDSEKFIRLPKRTDASKAGSFLARMTLDTLKHGNITQIHRMFEWLVGPMARFALSIGQAAEVDGVLNG